MKGIKSGICIVISVILASCSLLSAADLTLVKDGKPNAVIIAADEAQAQTAAVEIQKYLEKMSGARLPVLKEGETDSTQLPVKILIGHTKIAEKNKIVIPAGFKEVVGDPKVFEEEGFIIKTRNNQIFIGGNSDGPYRGTIYAGYEFLERLGCRWYFPGEWGEVIPEKKTITFPETDLVSKPDFALRENNLGGWFPSTAEERKIFSDWENKIKYTQGSFYPPVGDGFLAYLVPPNEFYPKEPELFQMNQQGSREPMIWSNGKYYENVTMLSLGNPRTLEVAVQNLKEAFAGKKSTTSRIVSRNGFGISPPDGAVFDYDPKYKDLNQNFNYPNYIHHPMNSEEFFGFAAKLAKEFPDKWVSTMAYAGREMPPQGVEIPQNIAVMYAPISSCVLHPGNDPACWRRTETISIMKQWCKLTPHVYLYDYNPGFLLGSFVPERDVSNFAINAKLYKEMKIKGFQSEGRKTFMITWISYYIRGKLMWDANADVEALKKDFYNTFFGPEAGPLVQQWWDECEKALGSATVHCHEDWLVNHIYTVDFTKKIHQYVEKAEKCAMTPKQRERFNAFVLIADHLEAIAARDEAEKKLDYKEAIKQAQRAEDDVAKLYSIYSFFIGPKKHPDFNNGWMERYIELSKKVYGEEGTMIAQIPLESKFQRDLYNEGVIGQWYLPSFDDKKWGTKNTFYTWDQQDKPEDAKGHDYDGYGWYRFTVRVPANMVNKPLKLHLGGVINEGWVWINGNYVGHREWKLWWAGRQALEMDVDVTGKVKAGDNVVAVRVWNNAEIGGLLRRGFLWASTK
ncbi:MAG TPA: DUF4838 domain-containing protein [Candidatus Ratteibacteria bacterium]|nr:DUF4838 domain-containing protein [Candidatus Ratteibacteria bacterium]